MLFVGWEVRIVKNCDRGQHFRDLGQLITIRTDHYLNIVSNFLVLNFELGSHLMGSTVSSFVSTRRKLMKALLCSCNQC